MGRYDRCLGAREPTDPPYEYEKMKKATCAALILGIALIAIAATPGVVLAQDKVTTLRWASFVSPKSANNAVTVPAFAKAIEDASEGTLKIEHFPGGTLGKGPVQQLSMVENAVADIAEVVVAYSPGRFPELSIFELPFLAKSNVEAGLAAWKIYEKGLVSDFDDLMLVGVIMSGPYGISTTRPIRSVKDLAGLRLRAAGPIQNEIVTRLGAVPVGNVPAPAIAANISRGVIDGTLMAPGNVYTFRIADAATHHNFDMKLGSVAVIFPMRRDTYSKLPAKAKAAFDRYSGEWLTRKLGEGLDRQQADAEKKLASAGTHTIHDWDAGAVAEVQNLLAPIIQKHDTTNDKGVNLYREVLAAIKEVRASR